MRASLPKSGIFVRDSTHIGAVATKGTGTLERHVIFLSFELCVFRT
jgi:hypothetical protein